MCFLFLFLLSCGNILLVLFLLSLHNIGLTSFQSLSLYSSCLTKIWTLLASWLLVLFLVSAGYDHGGKSFYEPTKFMYILFFTFWNVPLLSVFEMVTNTTRFASSRPLFLSFLQNNRNKREHFFLYMHPVLLLCSGIVI